MTKADDIIESGEPFDRLTELCDIMQESIHTPENEDVRGIIFLHDADRGGMVLMNYTDTSSAMADLLVHMKALFASQGKGFGVMTDQGFMLMDVD
jgi:hypothetical protein